jgi:CRISPR-associated protein Csd2
MSAERLVIFEHDSVMGNQPVQDLFSRVIVERKDGGTEPARDFSQYAVKLDGKELSTFKTIVKV